MDSRSTSHQLPKTSEATMRIVSFSTLFVIGTDTLLTAPLLPLLSKEFNTSTEQSGWFVSAYALGYAVFALIAGPLSDRIDRRRIILTGSIGFTLFTGLCGLAWGFWSLFTARFLAGVFASLISPQIWASIPMTVPKQAIIKTMGYATAGLAIAQIAGIPVGSFLSTYGWQIPFFAIATASLLLWVILYSRFPSIPPCGCGARWKFSDSLPARFKSPFTFTVPPGVHDFPDGSICIPIFHRFMVCARLWGIADDNRFRHACNRMRQRSRLPHRVTIRRIYRYAKDYARGAYCTQYCVSLSVIDSYFLDCFRYFYSCTFPGRNYAPRPHGRATKPYRYSSRYCIIPLKHGNVRWNNYQRCRWRYITHTVSGV